jgi:hypothetical protein
MFELKHARVAFYLFRVFRSAIAVARLLALFALLLSVLLDSRFMLSAGS